MSDVSDLGFERRRREAENGNGAWTAKDALQDLILDIDAGKINPDQLIIIARTNHENNTFDEHFSLVGLCYSEGIGMLEYRKHRWLDEMCGV